MWRYGFEPAMTLRSEIAIIEPPRRIFLSWFYTFIYTAERLDDWGETTHIIYAVL